MNFRELDRGLPFDCQMSTGFTCYVYGGNNLF